jgi:transcriptional regulator with XRE-family HTH domain
MIKIKGRAITAARDLLKLTQHGLAAACEISNGTLSRIEAESVTPHAATIRKIAKELTRRGIEFTNGTGVGVRLDYKRAAEYEESLKPVATTDKITG